jgi:hypothetical protein
MSRNESGDACDSENDWTEAPFANPAIRAEYQMALGRLILAHNEVDFWMSALLTKAAVKLAPDGSLGGLCEGQFAQRATNIILLMKVAPTLALGGVGNGRLLELNAARNLLAHGHFDQDPYEGTFAIVRLRRHGQNAERNKSIDAAKINAYAMELEGIARHMSAVDDFFEIASMNEADFDREFGDPETAP